MASAFILLPFYILLPKAIYGALALCLAFAFFIQILVTYSFDSSLYIHYHEYKNDRIKLSSFISTAFSFMLLISAGVGLCFVLGGELVFRLLFDEEKISFYPYGLMAVVIGIAQGLFKVYNTLLQSRQKPELYFLSNVLIFSAIVALTIFGLHLFPDSLLGPLGARVIAGVIAIAWVLYQIYREFGFHFNFPLLSSTFSYNHYTFIYQVQQWVINYFDRFLMLFAALSLDDVGMYDFVMKCIVVIDVIMTGLQSSFFPLVVDKVITHKQRETTVEINRYYNGLIAVVMVLVSGSILVFPFAVDIIDRHDQYGDAVRYFPFIAAFCILKAIRLYFAFPYGALKYTRPLPIIYTVIIAVKIGLMIVLIQRMGIYGLVIASLVSIALEILILKRVIRGKFTFVYNPFKIMVAPVVLLIAILVLEFFLGDLYALQVHGFYIILVSGFLLWLYRKELPLLFSKFVK